MQHNHIQSAKGHDKFQSLKEQARKKRDYKTQQTEDHHLAQKFLNLVTSQKWEKFRANKNG